MKENPNPKSELDYVNPYTLLVAVVLSAQATDKSVNKATKDLFKIVTTPQQMLELGEENLITYIKSIGLYKSKAKHIIGLSEKLIENFGGKIPDNREDLMTLPGVGRKTANVVLNVIFNEPTMPVDTHLLRICPKIGLAEGKTPEEVEKSLMQRIPQKYAQSGHHWLLLHGRYVCTARNPKCQECIIADLCKHNDFSENYFSQFDWNSLIFKNTLPEIKIEDYQKILCGKNEFPEFLRKYLSLPILQRLAGIGLLCGSDWTNLFCNRFYYSRLDHSLGVALIIWNFTKDKAQTIAGLLHDVSTPVFSHVSDFRKGDALTQTVTESINVQIIRQDSELKKLLSQDQLSIEQIEDYHKYPIADNEIPCLSADRLEYMFPSGMVLQGIWSLEEVEKTYNDICVLKNENGIDELGFKTLKIAEDYCCKFCLTGHVLQMNEDKITLHLLGQIMNLAVEENILQESDFMNLSETEIIEKISGKGSKRFKQLYNTFRNMKSIEHTNECLNEEEYFCINLKVKQRYINPLVITKNGVKRLNECSSVGSKLISDFLKWEDTKYGCVRYLNL